jgi:serpin B
MRKLFVPLFLVGLFVIVSCDNEGGIDDKETVKGSDKTEPVDSVVLIEGNVVEHAFTRADAAPLNVTLSDQEKSVIESGYQFATSLFEEIAGNTSADNICFSPMSLQVLLGMILNGFDEDVKSELIELFWNKDVSMDLINNGYSKAKTALENTNCVKMSNGLWLQKGFKVYDSFLNVGHNSYDSEIGNLDFASSTQSSLDSICQWAYDHTYGKIRKLDLEITGNTNMILANTTWFASEWASPFDPAYTYDGDFVRSDGQIDKVKMMTKEAKLPYKMLETYNVVSLAFKHNSYRMDFVVPQDGYSLESIIPNIDWSMSLDTGRVFLQLPRFHISTNTKMRPILEDIGASNLFADGKLTGLTANPKDLFIKNINQTIEMDLSESGVEAAAGSVADVVVRGGNVIIIDRPFAFVIRDNATGSFLFMGKVSHIN